MKRILLLLPLISLFLTLKAQTDTLALGEAIVTGTRTATSAQQLPMTVSTVVREAIEERGSLSLLPVLTEEVPGLFASSRGMIGYGVSDGAAGQMTIRGVGGMSSDASPTSATTTGVLLLIDGEPQYMSLMGHSMADAMQGMLAERVEVVHGSSSVLYGSNAMAGVVNIITRKSREEGLLGNYSFGGGSYGTFTSEGTTRYRRGKFFAVFAANYARTDGHRSDMEFEQYGGYAKLGCELNRYWTMSGGANLTHFNSSNPGSVLSPLIDNDQRITRGSAMISLTNNYRRTSGALTIYHNWGSHWINDGYSEGEGQSDYYYRSRDRQTGISFYQGASLFPGNYITLGVDYSHLGGKAWDDYIGHTAPDYILGKKEINEAAGYADFRQELFGYLTADVAARYNHHSVAGSEFVPQFGLAFRLPAQAEIKARASRGFRNPSIRELYMFRSANEELEAESLWSYELGFSQCLLADKRLTYGLNLYYINGDNMIQTVRIDGSPHNVNTGEIENWGIEAQVAWNLNATWQLSANYTWLRMLHPVLYAPEHQTFVSAKFHRKRWAGTASLQYIRGLYTDVSSNDKEEYVLLNLRASYQATRELQLFASGENLLSQQYEILDGFPMPKATFMAGVRLAL